MLSDRFKSMYRQMGLDRPAAAKLLHVSERTLHNWETGVHEIPYSAYKVLRLLSYTELPGAWSGWHIAAGRLWSPEGHGFRPEESSWWTALCRRSHLFHVLFKENAVLRSEALLQASAAGCEAAPADACKKAPAKGEVQVTLHQTLNFERKAPKSTGLPCPAKVRYNLPKTLFTKTVKGGV